jgi:aspartate carbamoyltransferase catalytic subunit
MTRRESLEDMLHSIGSYCDCIVLRHPERDSVVRAARIVQVPLINGGNGDDEHPTQTVVDLFAIREALGQLEGLRIGVVGDIRGSRAAHSFIRGMIRFSPSELRIMYPSSRKPLELMESIPSSMVRIEHGIMVEGLDVLYMAGLPQADDENVLEWTERKQFCLTLELAKKLKRDSIVLSPLPRIDEIDTAVDALPVARYFQQSRNGLYARIAVLEYQLS